MNVTKNFKFLIVLMVGCLSMDILMKIIHVMNIGVGLLLAHGDKY